MATLLMHVQSEPEPPSQRSELRVPRALDRLVLSCLAKDPADRPVSAQELDRLLAEAVSTVWDAEEARAWWTLHHPSEASEPPMAGPNDDTLVITRAIPK